MSLLYNCKDELRSFSELLEYVFASKEKRRIMDCVPLRCVDCKILFDCRDKENGFKCKHGCVILNERETLPQKCRDCLLLYDCRDEYKRFAFKHKGCLLRRKGDEYKL